MHSRTRPAFTLVELLVVVTILAVLLALLVPAMDQAMYRAELTRCAATQKGLATAFTAYAAGNQRAYINRLAHVQSERPYYVGRGKGGPEDDRTAFQKHMGVTTRSLVCPLDDGGIDFSVEGNSASSWILANYDIWPRWGYTGEKAMRRLGDAFTYTLQADGVQYRFDLLTSDHEGMFNNNSGFISTHPDVGGGYGHTVYQDKPAPLAGAGGVTVFAPNINNTYSFWSGNTRTAVDRNFARADGSVQLTDRSLWPQDAVLETEERMVIVPMYRDGRQLPPRRMQLPKR